MAASHPLGKFGSEFSMTGVDTQGGNCAQDSALRIGASYAKRYIKATLSSKLSSWPVLNGTQWPDFWMQYSVLNLIVCQDGKKLGKAPKRSA